MWPHRFYGSPPYSIIILHGGPGAPGSLAPLARGLEIHYSLVEHLQHETTISNQLVELQRTVQVQCEPPVTMIGHSWGAWLGWIFAAANPELVKKLIMIGAGPFEEKYAENISRIRMQRLSTAEQKAVLRLSAILEKSRGKVKKETFKKLGRLIRKADTLAAISEDDHVTRYQPQVYEKIWPEAAVLRSSDRLRNMAGRIRCPVTAIHGDYDPHPADGVEVPLSASLDDFKMIRLEKCGHYPWNERFARDRFFTVLLSEIS